jgi:hypothetical protein
MFNESKTKRQTHLRKMSGDQAQFGGPSYLYQPTTQAAARLGSEL